MAPCIDIMQALEVEYLQHSSLSSWRPMQLTMQTPKYSFYLLQDNALERECPSVPHCGRNPGRGRGAVLAPTFHVHPLQTLTTRSISLQDNALERGCPSVPHCGRAIWVAGEAQC